MQEDLGQPGSCNVAAVFQVFDLHNMIFINLPNTEGIDFNHI